MIHDDDEGKDELGNASGQFPPNYIYCYCVDFFCFLILIGDLDVEEETVDTLAFLSGDYHYDDGDSNDSYDEEVENEDKNENGNQNEIKDETKEEVGVKIENEQEEGEDEQEEGENKEGEEEEEVSEETDEEEIGYDSDDMIEMMNKRSWSFVARRLESLDISPNYFSARYLMDDMKRNYRIGKSINNMFFIQWTLPTEVYCSFLSSLSFLANRVGTRREEMGYLAQGCRCYGSIDCPLCICASEQNPSYELGVRVVHYYHDSRIPAQQPSTEFDRHHLLLHWHHGHMYLFCDAFRRFELLCSQSRL